MMPKWMRVASGMVALCLLTACNGVARNNDDLEALYATETPADTPEPEGADPTPMTTEDAVDLAAYAIINYGYDTFGVPVPMTTSEDELSDRTVQRLALPKLGVDTLTAVREVALKNYGATLENGTAALSFGKDAVTGDLARDFNTDCLGVFALTLPQAMPTDEEAAFKLALATFPKVTGRSYLTQATDAGYLWYAVGETAGYDSAGQAGLIPERILLGIAPAGAKTQVFAMVVKGRFAIYLQP